MNVLHRVAGYDKRTERLEIEHAIPAAKSDEARAIASVTDGDDGLGTYPLNAVAARALGLAIDRHLDADRYDWFLEPEPTVALVRS